MLFISFVSMVVVFLQAFVARSSAIPGKKVLRQFNAPALLSKYSAGLSTTSPTTSTPRLNNSNETLSSYFLYSVYAGNGKCEGSAMSGGIRFGSCVAGEGSETNPVISYVYSSPSETTTKYTFSMCQFNNNDCSGKAALCQLMEMPKQCLSDDTGSSSTAFRLAIETATPWSVIGTTSGVVSE